MTIEPGKEEAIETETPAQTETESTEATFISEGGEGESVLSQLDDDTRGMMEALMNPTEGQEEEPAQEQEESPDAGTETDGQAAAEGDTADKPDEPAAKPEEGDMDSESALLDEIKSERGKNRVQSIISERNQHRQDIGAIQELFQGLAPQEIAEGVEFFRMVNSTIPKDLETALEILDSRREFVARKLGQPVLGVDLLRDRPDLKERVEQGDILQSDAERIAALEAGHQERIRQQQMVQQQQQVSQQQQAMIRQLETNIASAFIPFEKNADYPARRDMLFQFLQTGNNLEMVKAMPPQYIPQFLLEKYNSFSLPASQPAKAAPQPLRSIPTQQGAITTDKMTPEELIQHEMRTMGLIV